MTGRCSWLHLLTFLLKEVDVIGETVPTWLNLGHRIRDGQKVGDILRHADPQRPAVILVEAAFNIAHRPPIDQTPREIVGEGVAVIRPLLLSLGQLPSRSASEASSA